MQARTGVYDSSLLDKCFLCLPDFLCNALSAEQPVQSLTVNQLKVGQVTVTDIHSRAGMSLLSSGSRLSEMVIQRLKNYASLGDVQEPILVQDPSMTKAKS